MTLVFGQTLELSGRRGLGRDGPVEREVEVYGEVLLARRGERREVRWKGFDHLQRQCWLSSRRPLRF